MLWMQAAVLEITCQCSCTIMLKLQFSDTFALAIN